MLEFAQMREQERQLRFEFITPEIYIDGKRTEFSGITSDDDSPFLLNLRMHSDAQGDVWIFFQDTRWGISPNEAKLFPHIRFRSLNGGGLNSFISEELAKIPYSLNNFIEAEYIDDFEKEFELKPKPDSINPHSSLEVITSKDDKGFKIKSLENEDETFDDLRSFLDIEVTENGDVILTERNTIDELDGNTWFPVEISGHMLFKSRENGGKYPMLNEILKGLAERIVNAKDPRKI